MIPISQQIKDDIEEFLDNDYDYDVNYNSIKLNLENILNNYKNKLSDFKIVCDDSNNSHRFNEEYF